MQFRYERGQYMKKNIIIILAIIITILLGIVAALNINKDETEQTISQKVEKSNKENKIENRNENKVDNNEDKNSEQTEDELSNEENRTDGEGIEEEPKTDLEKAIAIVKKDWGKDDSVKFAQDGKTTDGKYIICVRDIETTNALAWYTVDVETGEFEKE